jgi:hypothetical protein
MDVNQNSKASVEFDLTRPLGLSRSGVTTEDGMPAAFIYSKALDGFNSICVARVRPGLGIGLTNEQERAAVDRIADEFVAPGFSEEEVKDIAYLLDTAAALQIDDSMEAARRLCADITARRRLNLSGAR